MKKKRIAAAGLAVIMALTAVGCHQTSKEDTAQTTVKENKEEKDTSKEQIEKEETEKKVLHPYIHTDSVSGYVNSADGSVQINYSLKTGGLVLSDEEAAAYPELDQALTLEYDTLKKSTQEDMNNLKESAEEMVEYMQGDDNMQLIAEYAPYVLRADENVVSYEQFYDDYYGGTHGYHSYAGFTFDTKTGKKLDLYDVITGEESVKAGIIQELKNKYASEDGLVENNTPEEDADAFFEYVDSKDQSGAVAWSLGADRLNIYYNPYNIGSWALGIVSVSLPFEKYPDAVKDGDIRLRCKDWDLCRLQCRYLQ